MSVFVHVHVCMRICVCVQLHVYSKLTPPLMCVSLIHTYVYITLSHCMSYCVCSIVQVDQKLLPDDVFEFTISNLDVELPYVVLVWAFSSSADHHPARVELPPLGEVVCLSLCVCCIYSMCSLVF